ncbi:MAG: hypothetical protein V3V04_05410 [Rhizobiaceae bacterium]
MKTPKKHPENRYVNDLRRYSFGQDQFNAVRGIIVPIGLSLVFLALVALFVSRAYTGVEGE